MVPRDVVDKLLRRCEGHTPPESAAEWTVAAVQQVLDAALAATSRFNAGDDAALREAVKRLQFNADFQRGYGNSEFFMRRTDADVILAALRTGIPVTGEGA